LAGLALSAPAALARFARAGAFAPARVALLARPRFAAAAGVPPLPSAGGGAALSRRAAARRAVERCGRVRGRFASTPWALSDPLGRPLLSLAALTGTSLLNPLLQALRQSADRAEDALAWVL
jgi:hypothetical protein